MKKQFFFGLVGVAAFLLITNNVLAAATSPTSGELKKYYQGTVTEIGNGVVTITTTDSRIVDQANKFEKRLKESNRNLHAKKSQENKIVRQKNGKQKIADQGSVNRVEKKKEREAKKQKLARKQSGEKHKETVLVTVNPVLLREAGLTKGSKVLIDGSFNATTNTIDAVRVLNVKTKEPGVRGR